MENKIKVGLNPLAIVAKQIAHWFIYLYDIVDYSQNYVDERLEKILKCYAYKYWLRSAVVIQIISERKNIETGWTKMETVEKNYLYIKKKLDELMNNEKN